MEKVIKIINNNQYEFINESKGTQNGFKHITTLWRGYTKLKEHTAHYINRTWESYEYQSVMRGCVLELIADIKDRAYYHYKIVNNLTRLSKKKKEEINKQLLTSDIDYVELIELLQTL